MLTEVAGLAVFQISNIRFFSPFIHPDNIHWAVFHTFTAADTRIIVNPPYPHWIPLFLATLKIG